MTKKKPLRRQTPKSRKGFTLVELMVTIGIMTIINGVIFFNYPKVMANLALRRTADEIALTARQAQAYAMAAKTVAGASVPPDYGVHFDTSDPYSIILFADDNGNSQYDGNCTGGGDTCVQTFDIQTKDKISNLCGDIINCDLNKVDIVYSRNNPTAIITTNPSGSYSSVKIVIQSRRDPDSTKEITIHSNGYVSIK